MFRRFMFSCCDYVTSNPRIVPFMVAEFSLSMPRSAAARANERSVIFITLSF